MAKKLTAINRYAQFDKRKCMELAIEVMRKSVSERRGDGKATPKVGAVLVSPDGKVIESAYRGELREGDHAEFTLLERKLRDKNLTGCFLFATLEPCADGARKPPKVECAKRIVNARIKKVWIGIEDPDPLVARKGIKFLQDSGVEVEMFDKDFQDIIEEENKDFLKQALHRASEAKLSPKKIELTTLEKPLPNITIDEFSTEAVKLYIQRTNLKIEPDSPEFISLLEQKELVQHEITSLSSSVADEARRVDMMPFFVHQGGINGNGSLSDTFINNGERVNIISYKEFEDNPSYITIHKGWVEKGKVFTISGKNRKSEVNTNSQGYHVEILYEDKDGRTYSQEFSRYGIGKPSVFEPKLFNSINNRYNPTGLGFLLFGKNPSNLFPQAVLKVEAHYGNNEPEIHDFAGPLVLIPEQVENWLKKVLSSKISRAQFVRTTEYAYPIQVLREAIINAIAHRDYAIEGAKCYLIIDNDKIVVKSPGLPVNPIKFEDFKNLNAPSLSRNPKLMAVFNEMHYAEERGIGMKEMKSLPNKYNLPSPVITWEDPYINITFPRNQNYFESVVDSSKLSQLNDEEKTGLAYIMENKNVSKKQYSEHFKFNDKKAQRHLLKFVDLGLVALKGKGPSSSYQYQDNDQDTLS